MTPLPVYQSGLLGPFKSSQPSSCSRGHLSGLSGMDSSGTDADQWNAPPPAQPAHPGPLLGPPPTCPHGQCLQCCIAQPPSWPRSYGPRLAETGTKSLWTLSRDAPVPCLTFPIRSMGMPVVAACWSFEDWMKAVRAEVGGGERGRETPRAFPGVLGWSSVHSFC